jgi:hypothetical protein
MAYWAGSSGTDVPSPSTYRLNMQKVAAISTVSWISRSVAPAPRARATAASETSLPSTRTSEAISSSARIFPDTGASPAGPPSAASTCSAPPGSSAAALAPCDPAQYSHSLPRDT